METGCRALKVVPPTSVLGEWTCLGVSRSLPPLLGKVGTLSNSFSLKFLAWVKEINTLGSLSAVSVFFFSNRNNESTVLNLIKSQLSFCALLFCELFWKGLASLLYKTLSLLRWHVSCFSDFTVTLTSANSIVFKDNTLKQMTLESQGLCLNFEHFSFCVYLKMVLIFLMFDSYNSEAQKHSSSTSWS